MMSWRAPSSARSLARNEYGKGGWALTEGRAEGSKLESRLIRGVENAFLRGTKVPLGCSLHQSSLISGQTAPGGKYICLPRIPEERVGMENTGLCSWVWEGQSGQSSGPDSGSFPPDIPVFKVTLPNYVPQTLVETGFFASICQFCWQEDHNGAMPVTQEVIWLSHVWQVCSWLKLLQPRSSLGSKGLQPTNRQSSKKR